MNNLKEYHVYYAKHLDIAYEIHETPSKDYITNEPKTNWTYYIYLDINRFSSEYKGRSFWMLGKKDKYGNVMYGYINHPIIGNMDFHCGCTYYNKRHGFDGANKVVKIGCDYMHYWDEGHEYFLTDVQQDAINTIEKFRILVPEYQYRCCGNGGIYRLEDGELNESGAFFSNEYKNSKLN